MTLHGLPRRSPRRRVPRPAGRRRVVSRRSWLRVVDTGSGRRSRRRIPFLLAAFTLTGPAVFGVVMLQTLVSQSSFRMEVLEQRNTELEQTFGRLRLEVAGLSAPERIAAEARRLGLRLPERVETIAVGSEPSREASDGGEVDPTAAVRSHYGLP